MGEDLPITQGSAVTSTSDGHLRFGTLMRTILVTLKRYRAAATDSLLPSILTHDQSQNLS